MEYGNDYVDITYDDEFGFVKEIKFIQKPETKPTAASQNNSPLQNSTRYPK